MNTSLMRTNKCAATSFAMMLAAFLTAGLAICPLASAEDGAGQTFDLKTRVWTDTSGEYRLNAALVAYQDRELTLRKEDGSEIQISVDKLSRADRQFVANRLREARQNREPQPRAGEGSEPKSDVTENNKPIVVDKSIHARQMYGIDWYDTKDSLIVASADNPKDEKPIMWFRVLGDLSGFM